MSNVLGERLHQVRMSSQLGIIPFAKSVGVHRDTIWMVENNYRQVIKSDTLTRICQQYDVSADWLLGLKDTP